MLGVKNNDLEQVIVVTDNGALPLDNEQREQVVDETLYDSMHRSTSSLDENEAHSLAAASHDMDTTETHNPTKQDTKSHPKRSLVAVNDEKDDEMNLGASLGDEGIESEPVSENLARDTPLHENDVIDDGDLDATIDENQDSNNIVTGKFNRKKGRKSKVVKSSMIVDDDDEEDDNEIGLDEAVTRFATTLPRLDPAGKIIASTKSIETEMAKSAADVVVESIRGTTSSNSVPTRSLSVGGTSAAVTIAQSTTAMEPLFMASYEDYARTERRLRSCLIRWVAEPAGLEMLREAVPLMADGSINHGIVEIPAFVELSSYINQSMPHLPWNIDSKTAGRCLTKIIVNQYIPALYAFGDGDPRRGQLCPMFETLHNALKDLDVEEVAPLVRALAAWTAALDTAAAAAKAANLSSHTQDDMDAGDAKWDDDGANWEEEVIYEDPEEIKIRVTNGSTAHFLESLNWNCTTLQEVCDLQKALAKHYAQIWRCEGGDHRLYYDCPMSGTYASNGIKRHRVKCCHPTCEQLPRSKTAYTALEEREPQVFKRYKAAVDAVVGADYRPPEVTLKRGRVPGKRAGTQSVDTKTVSPSPVTSKYSATDDTQISTTTLKTEAENEMPMEDVEFDPTLEEDIAELNKIEEQSSPEISISRDDFIESLNWTPTTKVQLRALQTSLSKYLAPTWRCRHCDSRLYHLGYNSSQDKGKTNNSHRVSCLNGKCKNRPKSSLFLPALEEREPTLYGRFKVAEAGVPDDVPVTKPSPTPAPLTSLPPPEPRPPSQRQKETPVTTSMQKDKFPLKSVSPPASTGRHSERVAAANASSSSTTDKNKSQAIGGGGLNSFNWNCQNVTDLCDLQQNLAKYFSRLWICAGGPHRLYYECQVGVCDEVPELGGVVKRHRIRCNEAGCNIKPKAVSLLAALEPREPDVFARYISQYHKLRIQRAQELGLTAIVPAATDKRTPRASSNSKESSAAPQVSGQSPAAVAVPPSKSPQKVLDSTELDNLQWDCHTPAEFYDFQKSLARILAPTWQCEGCHHRLFQLSSARENDKRLGILVNRVVCLNGKCRRTPKSMKLALALQERDPVLYKRYKVSEDAYLARLRGDDVDVSIEAQPRVHSRSESPAPTPNTSPLSKRQKVDLDPTTVSPNVETPGHSTIDSKEAPGFDAIQAKYILMTQLVEKGIKLNEMGPYFEAAGLDFPDTAQ